MGPAIFFVATGYIDCNRALAVFCIISAVGLSGVSWAGWSVNHLDLAPIYAGCFPLKQRPLMAFKKIFCF